MNVQYHISEASLILHRVLLHCDQSMVGSLKGFFLIQRKEKSLHLQNKAVETDNLIFSVGNSSWYRVMLMMKMVVTMIMTEKLVTQAAHLHLCNLRLLLVFIRSQWPQPSTAKHSHVIVVNTSRVWQHMNLMWWSREMSKQNTI